MAQFRWWTVHYSVTKMMKYDSLRRNRCAMGTIRYAIMRSTEFRSHILNHPSVISAWWCVPHAFLFSPSTAHLHSLRHQRGDWRRNMHLKCPEQSQSYGKSSLSIVHCHCHCPLSKRICLSIQPCCPVFLKTHPNPNPYPYPAEHATDLGVHAE